MAKYELKTKVNEISVADFLNAVPDTRRREDGWKIHELMKEITGEEAKMWGPSIVGYGRYHYKYESGQEGDMCKAGFSPRKNALTLYILPGFDKEPEIMSRLGKYTTGKSCLYIKKIEDVNTDALRDLIKYSWEYMTEKYG